MISLQPDLSFNISFLILVLVKWQQSLTGYRALLWTLLAMVIVRSEVITMLNLFQAIHI